jgi:hypothetical protein
MTRFWSLKTGLLWLAVAGFGGSACGGQPEVVRSPPPVKVAWGDDSEAEATADAPEAPPPDTKGAEPEPAATEPRRAGPVEIDLDAVASPQAEPAPEEAAEEAEEEAEEKAAGTEPAPTVASDPLALELQKRRTAAKARNAAKAKPASAKGKKSSAKAKPSSSKKSAPAAPSAPTYKGSDPCRAASFSVARVREACDSGGRAAAKRVMKDAIGKATATGQTLKCSNCHANQRDVSLNADAVAELKRWLDGSSS